MPDKSEHVAIVGAGLVGSLLSIYLAKRGYQVSVFERRADMRKAKSDAGRSINLALSARGILALEELGLAANLKKEAVPMHGRMMHNTQGGLSFLPYGMQGQFINSISRSGLTMVLMNEAEKRGVKYYFDHRCLTVDLNKTEITVQTAATVQNIITSTHSFDLIIGTDGAFSAVRGALQLTDRFNFLQEYIDHGYKELHIPPGPAGEFQLEKNALHIWPRESFMMIALPNPDGSFTCTLFFPWEGTPSFQSLTSSESVTEFFTKTFPDAIRLMPSYLDDFTSKPASSLVSVKCWPWVKNKTLILGDAAHAILPFYGQGMNAGFEDCRILNHLLDQHKDTLDPALSEFQKLRKPDTDAIAQLAEDNFVEMRDLVADAEFLLRKKIEAKLHALYPEKWIPLYSMVTFYDQVRYSEAYAIGCRQKEIMDNVMKAPDINTNWELLDFKEIASQL